ncbi:MAG: Asp-tRNA(Asn)/Glu-tRNA(Gln) amidotransferase subunit GatC [Vulcanimicrobiaceae bacterium]
MTADTIDVRYVAKLARIALTDEEIGDLQRELADLLEHVNALADLDTGAVAATAQVVESRNVVRADIAGPSLAREVILSQAPQAQGAYFRVPRIIAEES